jgi:hypothetical protein
VILSKKIVKGSMEKTPAKIAIFPMAESESELLQGLVKK